MPSAAAPNALHRPSAASPRCRLNPTNAARSGHHHDPAGQRHRALTRPQRLAGQVQRHQRRRARRVHRHRRALQPQHVRHPARQPRCAALPVSEMPLGLLLRPSRVAVVRGAVPANTPVWLPRSGGGIDPGPLQRLPGHLQQQPLLRVHRQRLARADPEEPRVELPRLMHKPALRVYWCQAGPDPGRTAHRRPSPGPLGKSDIASVPDRTSSHSSSGLRTPPGNRQPIPTTATGSWSRSSISCRRRRACRRLAVARRR